MKDSAKAKVQDGQPARVLSAEWCWHGTQDNHALAIFQSSILTPSVLTKIASSDGSRIISRLVSGSCSSMHRMTLDGWTRTLVLHRHHRLMMLDAWLI